MVRLCVHSHPSELGVILTLFKHIMGVYEHYLKILNLGNKNLIVCVKIFTFCLSNWEVLAGYLWSLAWCCNHFNRLKLLPYFLFYISLKDFWWSRIRALVKKLEVYSIGHRQNGQACFTIILQGSCSFYVFLIYLCWLCSMVLADPWTSSKWSLSCSILFSDLMFLKIDSHISCANTVIEQL